MRTKTIKTKVKQFIKIKEDLERLSGKNKYPEHDCPLRADHYNLSQAIFGPGVIWHCGFCGKRETE